MSYNGSGVYTLPGAQLANGATVSATENNQFRNDVAAALNVAWTRDGQAPATNDIPMGSNKLTELAQPTTEGDALAFGKNATVDDLAVTGNFDVTGDETVGGNLTVTGTASLGGEYFTPYTGFKNRIINGSFEVAQRGTSQTQATLGYGSVDRWYFAADSGSYTVQQGAENAPFGGSYLGQFIAIDAASVNGGYLMQRVENVRTLAGSTVTLSYFQSLISGSDTGSQPYLRQNFGSGGSSSVNANAVSDTVVGFRRILVFNVPSTSSKTIGTNSSLDVIIPFNGTFLQSYWGVQLEPGSTATQFEYRPYGTELALCQRYYTVNQFHVYASSSPALICNYKVSMRASPTISGGGAGFYVLASNTELVQPYQDSTAIQTITSSAEL